MGKHLAVSLWVSGSHQRIIQLDLNTEKKIILLWVVIFKMKATRKCLGLGNSLVVQWLGLYAFAVEGTGSGSCQGIKILQAMQHGQKKKKKRDVWMFGLGSDKPQSWEELKLRARQRCCCWHKNLEKAAESVVHGAHSWVART